MTTEFKNKSKKPVKRLDHVTIRFAGDSGDGMQFTGTQFTTSAAMLGNDVFTFPNYPSEIRAPQGSLYGVSGFQVQIGAHNVDTPGDKLDLLVAMNPAALKKNLKDLKKGGMIIVDSDAFTKANLLKAKYETNPLEDGSLKDYIVVQVPMTSLTREALKDIPIDSKSKTRSKNMFALGMVYWLYGKDPKYTIEFLRKKFKNKPEIVEANIKALKTGWNYAETLELIPVSYIIDEAPHHAEEYKIITGNTATAWGFLAAAEKAGLQLYLGSYPITPATDILQELSKYRQLDVIAFQAEDEIAGISSAIGASFTGKLAITTTSGPGLALKSEAIGLAVMLEIPLVIVDVQRGGPSTGLPTKTEQADLMQALFGRNGESPVIVVAAKSPADAFKMAFEASKLTLEHMTPVILLTDGYIGNGSEPWPVQRIKDLPEINPPLVKEKIEGWHPYDRDPETLARKWVVPGVPGMEHVIGGLEKDKSTGAISYEPENHEYMVRIRQAKVDKVADFIPPLETEFRDEGDLLVVGWGGTYGSLRSAVNELNEKGYRVGLAHFNYINPLPHGVKDVFSKFDKIVVAELNLGQFANYLRMKHPEFRYEQYNKIQGLPFTTEELVNAFEKLLK
ncbi:MAG: 2-oxoacid:acceptor oxidoreductase subunit alpha [Chlorobi bacterium]|nr:2-oxoacid:acceptor oxidoreductase subunit alpha [Chlorobiota bacterium]